MIDLGGFKKQNKLDAVYVFENTRVGVVGPREDLSPRELKKLLDRWTETGLDIWREYQEKSNV